MQTISVKRQVCVLKSPAVTVLFPDLIQRVPLSVGMRSILMRSIATRSTLMRSTLAIDLVRVDLVAIDLVRVDLLMCEESKIMKANCTGVGLDLELRLPLHTTHFSQYTNTSWCAIVSQSTLDF